MTSSRTRPRRLAIMRLVRGREELNRAAEALAWRLPDELAVLARLAYNYRWAWTPGGSELFRSVDPRRWRLVGGNPVRLPQEAPTGALERAADAPALLGTAAALERALRDDLAREPRGPVDAEHPVAF